MPIQHHSATGMRFLITVTVDKNESMTAYMVAHSNVLGGVRNDDVVVLVL